LKKGYRKAPVYAARSGVYQLIQQDKLALNDLNLAIDADKRSADLYLKRGNLNLDLENYNLAAADFSEAIRLRPEALEIYVLRARARAQAGMNEEALADFRFYLGYFPNDHRAWYYLGEMYKSDGRYIDALPCFSKCIALKTEADYFLSRGETYFFTRTYRYAINDLAMALDLDPKNGKAYLIKGHAHLQSGEPGPACFNYEMAAKLGIFEAIAYKEKYCKP